MAFSIKKNPKVYKSYENAKGFKDKDNVSNFLKKYLNSCKLS